MDVSTEVYNYKLYHEQFMQNLNGTTATEVLLVMLPASGGIFLSTSLCAVSSCLMAQKIWTSFKFANWLPFFVDFVTIIVPILLSFTICSDIHVVITLIFLLGLFIFVAYCFTVCREVFSQGDISTLFTTLILPSKRPCVTNFRAVMNLMTGICILAVDFEVFPRRFAKTETFGYGLMDTGVGLFVISNAIVTPEAVGYKGKSQTLMPAMWKAIKSSVPLLLLGSARFFLTKHIDYQEHISEYGVHWNFYITLAMTKMLCTLILQFVGSNYSVLITTVVIGIHQLILSCGIQDWVLSDVARENFVTANREGIISSLGYVALYFAGISLGRGLRNYKSTLKYNLYLMGKQTVIGVFLWSATALCKYWFGVSRRLANIGYVIWMLALTTTVLVILMSVELLTWALNMVMKANMKNEKGRRPHFTVGYVPLTLEAINYNGLFFFLLANLITGLINICVHTLTLGVLQGFSIICGYVFVICYFTVLLYFKNIKLKVW
jgi:hypothetical protein